MLSLFAIFTSEVNWDRYRQGVVKDSVIRANLHRNVAGVDDVPITIKMQNMRPLGNNGYNDMVIHRTDFVDLKPKVHLSQNKYI